MHSPVLALSVLLSCGVLAAAQSSVIPPSDESPIRDLVEKYVAARESMDAAKIEALFTPDADQLVSSGEWRRGRAEVVKGTLASSRRETGSRRSITVETVRFLSSNSAVADGHYDLIGPGARTRHMWTTLICQRDQTGWKIAAIRNMLPAAP